jgi:polynucleotide 5'-kinase involved in rRNA processing
MNEFSPPELIGILCNLIEVGSKRSMLAEGKDVILISGTTGTGKSTFANYLAGTPM